MNYTFKRDFYTEVTQSIKRNRVSFLLGPRKCGKTVCLKQISLDFPTAEYVDFKELTDDEKLRLCNEIYSDIKNDSDKIYLLDEITYAINPELFINKLSSMFSEYDTNHIHLVFAGGQSTALKRWGNIAFAGNAGYIEADFLTYSEWLRYKKTDIISEETFEQFLCEVDEFYGIDLLREYLQGCLDATITANAASSNYIYGNECGLLDVDTLLDICYVTLFSLCNQAMTESIMKSKYLYRDIDDSFSEVCQNIDIDETISNTFISRYNSFQGRDLETLRQGFVFLYNCGLITLTPVTNDLNKISDVNRALNAWKMGEDAEIDIKGDLFRNYNVFITYPSFYMAIIKDVVVLTGKLPRALLGSITECYIRGLLPYRNIAEYHDTDDNKIDYVDVSNEIAIEITVNNKQTSNICFDILPKSYFDILLTKDQFVLNEKSCRIPYYEFIFDDCDVDKCIKRLQKMK